MINLRTRMALLMLTAVGVPACASNPINTASYIIHSQQNLPDSLAESSGLFCRNNEILTINDSGNAPTVYTLNKSAQIKNEFANVAKNRDWEAITADDKAIYIGEFGNNNGKRKDLKIIVIGNDGSSKTLRFEYANNKPEANAAYAHDVDAEALVAKDNALILFSKSWLSGVTQVFSLNTHSEQQVLSAIASITLPGMVTGADWDAALERFVVVGYSASGFGVSAPFVALLTSSFEVERTEKLQGFNQVEGVCSNNGDIWFTQERNVFAPAKLVNIRLNRQ